MNFKNENSNNFSKAEQEIIKLFRSLNELEKEFYLSDIKARVLKKQLEK
jgi:hypothetical protein